MILFQITPDIKEAGKVWADKLEESLCEAKLVDSYKMQVNLDGDDDEKPVNQKVASIIKEGYLRKKKPGNSAVQDMKRTWERRYFVLYNDGKLKYYDSRAKGEEKGSLDMRFFAIQEIEEEMEVDDEDEPGGEKQSLKVQGQFFKIMKGKQFGLYSGKHCFYMASPEREVCDEWISTLQTTLSILYQKSPLFSQDFLRVYMMDGTFTTMPLTETTKTRDVVKFMCKKHTLNNESEFGLLELWDHPGINGNMSERKLPNDELLLDQTMLTWEQARGPARDPVAHSTRPPHISHPTPPSPGGAQALRHRQHGAAHGVQARDAQAVEPAAAGAHEEGAAPRVLPGDGRPQGRPLHRRGQVGDLRPRGARDLQGPAGGAVGGRAGGGARARGGPAHGAAPPLPAVVLVQGAREQEVVDAPAADRGVGPQGRPELQRAHALRAPRGRVHHRGAQDRLLVPPRDRAERAGVDADVHRARPPRAALLLRAVHRRDVVRRQDPQGARRCAQTHRPGAVT